MAFSTRHNALPNGHVSHLVDVGYVEHYVLAIAYVTRWFELIACVWITWDDNPWISKGHTSWLLVDLAKDCADNVEIVCALSAGFYWSWYQAYYKYKLCMWEELRSSRRNKEDIFSVVLL